MEGAKMRGCTQTHGVSCRNRYNRCPGDDARARTLRNHSRSSCVNRAGCSKGREVVAVLSLALARFRVCVAVGGSRESPAHDGRRGRSSSAPR